VITFSAGAPTLFPKISFRSTAFDFASRDGSLIALRNEIFEFNTDVMKKSSEERRDAASAVEPFAAASIKPRAITSD
jgi:hypothetical protein